MKQCSKCKETKPLESFAKNRARPDGRCMGCRECNNAANAAWRAKNRERSKARMAAWRAENRERELVQRRQKYLETRDAELARMKAFRENNRDYFVAWRKANAKRQGGLKKAWNVQNAAEIKEIAADLLRLFETLPLDRCEELAIEVMDDSRVTQFCHASSDLAEILAFFTEPDVQEELLAKTAEALLSA